MGREESHSRPLDGSTLAGLSVRHAIPVPLGMSGASVEVSQSRNGPLALRPLSTERALSPH